VRRAVAAVCLALLAAGCGGEASSPPEPIRFTTEDGIELAGDIRGGGSTAVVLAHMFPANRTSWADFASILAEEGYLALNFDFRGYGASDGTRTIPELWPLSRRPGGREPPAWYWWGRAWGGRPPWWRRPARSWTAW
jgi:hypothetical protein